MAKAGSPEQDPRIDAYIARSAPFARPILKRLRAAVHAGCPVVKETIKWGMPAFEHRGPLCGMAAFKAHCTFGFWKHTLMAERHPELQAHARDAMGSLGCIATVRDLPPQGALIGWVEEAAGLNEAGIRATRPKHPPKPRAETPQDLLSALRRRRGALARWRGMTPSHQREYIEWITEAKRPETRQRRLDSAVEWIAEGKSRNWKYARKER